MGAGACAVVIISPVRVYAKRSLGFLSFLTPKKGRGVRFVTLRLSCPFGLWFAMANNARMLVVGSRLRKIGTGLFLNMRPVPYCPWTGFIKTPVPVRVSKMGMVRWTSLGLGLIIPERLYKETNRTGTENSGLR